MEAADPMTVYVAKQITVFIVLGLLVWVLARGIK